MGCMGLRDDLDTPASDEAQADNLENENVLDVELIPILFDFDPSDWPHSI